VDILGSLTFSFGHAVGEGIQSICEGKSIEQTIFSMFVHWDSDLFADNPKQKKNFWLAVHAVRMFKSMRDSGYMRDYELVYYEDKPAVELGFIIHFPDGYVYRGFVDVVMRNIVTGEVIVLELKTASTYAIAPATYKNSAQAIGYSIVLDAIFPNLSSYRVHYLVYQTMAMEYCDLPFTKTYTQRAQWIQELLLDIETIKLYEQNLYPMHGESCRDWNRDCEYLNMCTLSTENLTKPLTPVAAELIYEDHSKYQVSISLLDLIRSQGAKLTGTEGSREESGAEIL
jgi:hypothetical protein